MPWQDQLRPASFRGKPFLIEESVYGSGRRIDVNQYPGRDLPFAEDLGRRAREFTVEAYVVGDDYIAARDALLDALEAAGSGTLVHPYYGTRTVSVGAVSIRESVREGGIARLSISFSEAGSNVFPSSRADTRGLLSRETTAARLGLQETFGDAFSVRNFPQFVSDAAGGITTDFATEVEDLATASLGDAAAIAQAVRDVQSFAEQVPALVRDPVSLAASLDDLIGCLSAVAERPGLRRAVLEPLTVFGSTLPDVPAGTVSRARQALNQESLTGLMRRISLVNLAAAVADDDFESYDGAVAARDAVADRLAAETTAAGDAGDDASWQALRSVGAAFARHMTEKSGPLARIVYREFPQTAPALATAYEIYEDATRDSDIAARNGIAHPGFVPGGVAIEMLSR